MLGIGRASQLAGWGTLPPPVVSMSTSSSVGYAVSQAPSYSLSNGMALTNGGQIDLTGYSSLAGYQHGKYTMAFSFRPNYSNTTYPANEYLGNIGRFQVLDYSNIGTLADGWFIYCTSNTWFDDSEGVRLSFGYGTPGFGQGVALPGPYLDWNGTWFYVVISASPNAGDFVNFAPLSYTSGNMCCRIAVYDQETGELYARQDSRHNDPNMPVITDLANPLPAGNPYSPTGDLFDLRMFTAGSVGVGEQLINNFWCSYGTMFDPIGLDQTGTAWRTTRPSKQIGSAVAWTNIQMTDTIVEGTTPSRNYWVKTSGEDQLSHPNNKAMGRTENNGWYENSEFNPSEIWTNALNTSIPKDRNI